MTSRKLMIGVLLLILPAVIAAGVMIATAEQRASAEPAVNSAQPPPQRSAGATVPSQPVQVATPTDEEPRRDLVIPATLESYEAADLYAKASGFVAEVKVDIGSRVRAGDPLVSLEIPEMMDDLRQAEAMLEAKRANVGALKAKSNHAALAIESARAQAQRARAQEQLAHISFTRKKELYEGKAISDQELDEARSQLAVAEATTKIADADIALAEGEKTAADEAVKVAMSEVLAAQSTIAGLKTLMRYATVTAPFDGVITKRMVDPGAFVRSAAQGVTTPLLSIAGTDRLRLVMELPEPVCDSVGPGTRVSVRVPALEDDAAITVLIARSATALTPRTRTMRVEADLDGRDGKLRAGMYARAVVHMHAEHVGLIIPSKAVRVRGPQSYVLIAKDGIAAEVPITIVHDDGIRSNVRGLSGDEMVITSATVAVSSGVPVKPVLADGAGE